MLALNQILFRNGLSIDLEECDFRIKNWFGAPARQGDGKTVIGSENNLEEQKKEATTKTNNQIKEI